MNLIKKSPVIILAYTRPQHLQRVLEALSQDDLALETQVFIFIDGLRNIKDKDLQQETISIGRSAVGFKEVCLQVWEENIGVFKSFIRAIEHTCKDNDSFIYLEDDIVPRPSFLDYMNKALLFYKDNQHVYAINSFSFPQFIPLKTPPLFFSFRFAPWGFATWKDRVQDVQWKGNLGWMKYNPLFWKRFNNDSWGWGWAMASWFFFPFLKDKIQPWDILFFLHHYKQKHVAIWRQETLVHNIGFDGSGMHTGLELGAYQDSLDVINSPNKPCFLTETRLNLELNKKISNEIKPLFRKKFFKTGVSIFKRERK